MAKIKYPTTFLKNRRTNLGLTQLEVASAIGVEKWALQKLEQRGEMPEVHFDKLSEILKVSVMNLYIEKYAPVMRAVFHIPAENFRAYVRGNIDKDKAFGHRTAILTAPDAPSGSKKQNLNNEAGLPELFKEVLRHVRNLTPKEGFASLVESGIYTPDGQLTPEYGGPSRGK